VASSPIGCAASVPHNDGLVKLDLHISENPLERLLVEVVALKDAEDHKSRTKMHAEHHGGILVRNPADVRVSTNDDETIAQSTDSIDGRCWLEIGRLVSVDMEDLDCVLDDGLEVDGHVVRDLRVRAGEGEFMQHAAVGLELSKLLVEKELQSRGAVVNAGCEDILRKTTTLIRNVDAVMVLEFLRAKPKAFNALMLDEGAVHAVLAVYELDQISKRVANRAAVVDHDILECLHESTLNVTRLGRLDGGINETLTTSHGVEEEPVQSETTKLRVLDESAGLEAEVVLVEMRKQAMAEYERNTRTLDGLLADTHRHLLDVVAVLQVFLRMSTRLVTSLAQLALGLALERLAARHTQRLLQLGVVGLPNDSCHEVLLVLDHGLDRSHRLRVGDRISNANAEAVVEQPEVDHLLQTRERVTTRLGNVELELW
jgi:hypothetical protein